MKKYLPLKKKNLRCVYKFNSKDVISFDKVFKKIINEKFKAHILIVDDDDRIRGLVKEYLNENNYLVSTAKDSK